MATSTVTMPLPARGGGAHGGSGVSSGRTFISVLGVDPTPVSMPQTLSVAVTTAALFRMVMKNLKHSQGCFRFSDI